MYLGLNIGSLLFEGEPLDTNSSDPVSIALPKLQRETDSASTPASKLLSDYTIAEVENSSNRIDESVLKADFSNTLDKICQEVHHQNCEELSKQSLENALEFQGRVDEDFIKEKGSDIDSLSPLFEGELLDTNIGDPVNIALPNLQRETDSAGTPASKLLSDVTAQNLMVNFEAAPLQPSKINNDFPKTAFLPPNFEQLQNNSNRIDESVLKADFYNTLDKLCQGMHHQNFEELSKQSLKNALEFQGRADEDFIKEKVSDIGSLSPLFEGELPDTTAYKLLSDYIIAEVENNSNRIDESVLKEDFYNTLDKKCQEKHHQNFEELSKQSLKDALEFQGKVYQDFIREKVELFEKQLVFPDRHEYSCIVTDCSFTHKYRAIIKKHLFKHIKVSPHYCEQCFPNIFFARDKTDLDRHKRGVHCLDKVISERGIKRIRQRVQNTIVENNSTRIDESVLKEDFYNTLDKKCQEKYHQNFEELSKQSLKNALKFQGRVYQNFTKEKVKLSEQQLVSSDKCKYPCILTDCSFTDTHKAGLKRHLFKHIKVSPYYCEQCLPYTFFARDMAALNRHKSSVHVLDKVISKRGIKRSWIK